MCSWTKPHAPPRVCYTSDSFWYFGQNLDWFRPVKLSIETDQVGKTVGLHLVSPSVAFSQTLELPFNRAMKAELQWTACLCLKFWCWWGARPLATLEWSWMVQGNGGGSHGNILVMSSCMLLLIHHPLLDPNVCSKSCEYVTLTLWQAHMLMENSPYSIYRCKRMDVYRYCVNAFSMCNFFYIYTHVYSSEDGAPIRFNGLSWFPQMTLKCGMPHILTAP